MTRLDRPHGAPTSPQAARNVCRFERVPRLSLDHLLGIEPSEATSERAPAYAT